MKKAIAIQGLFYGDEGKGTMTDFLVRHHKASLVVRYNGGSQAAHNVVTDEGHHHTFSQFGSGTLAGAKTYLSQYMLVDPLTLKPEADALLRILPNRPFDRPIVSPGAVVVTPFHQKANRLREISRDSRHGSVGMGIGEARAGQLAGEAILFRDLGFPERVAKMLITIRDKYIAEFDDTQTFDRPDPFFLAEHYHWIFRNMRVETFEEVSKEHDTVVFEGAQGVMLDETHGFEPYNTWTDCTFGNVYKLLDEAHFHGEMERIAVLRTYLTRHGAGPLLTEDPNLMQPEAHNKTHPWMGPVRLGHFDFPLMDRALRALGDVEGFALTHMDCPITQASVGNSFTPKELYGLNKTEAYLKMKPIYQPMTIDALPGQIQRWFRKPVIYTSHGPMTSHKACLENVAR